MPPNPSCISDTILIDIAVLCQETSPIEVDCSSNILELDDIRISKEDFKSIFYPHGENFGIQCELCRNNPSILPYITFLAPWRTIQSNPFSLLEQIIISLENDLNVTRNCFTKCSLVELTRELTNIKSLCDLNCCSLVTSLTWSNIESIIRDHYELYNCDCSEPPSPSTNQVILVISVIFKTPNLNVRPTIVKFKYRINV